MKKITELQRQILEYISNFSKENDMPPTVGEISSHFEISLTEVQEHISALQREGFISLKPKSSRSIRILKEENAERKIFTAQIPVLGTVAAGRPLLSEENLDGFVNLTEPFVRPGKKYFALHVRGASMINAGILEGDLAVVEQCETAVDGQIVVAVLDDAITLKRYYRIPDGIKLQPENPAFEPICRKDVRIVGILSSIVRTY